MKFLENPGIISSLQLTFKKPTKDIYHFEGTLEVVGN